MARLDRLGPAREVAQIGSVIGRGFSYGLLRSVADMEDAELQAALEKLADADIVLVQGLPPDSDYRFKHALIQDVAYENLLKSRRQVLHRRVAETLCDQFADTAAAEPEVLAHHFTQAGLTDAAIEWWGKAGDQALRRSAFQEAISHLGKAIEMADKAGNSAAGAPRSSYRPTTARPTVVEGLCRHGTDGCFHTCRGTRRDIEIPAPERSLLYGQWPANLLRGELQDARQSAEGIRQRSRTWRANYRSGIAWGRMLGLTCLCRVTSQISPGTCCEDALNRLRTRSRCKASRRSRLASRRQLTWP